MIAVTSISPGHINKDNQLKAIESMVESGFKVYSLNCAREIELLKDYPVEFIETEDTGEYFYGKPYVKVNAFRDFVMIYGDALIINSDIVLTPKIKSIIKDNGALILNRWDYVHDEFIRSAKVFNSGFDAFYLKIEYAQLLPDTSLVVGQCHWDYWLPMQLIRLGVTIYTSKQPVIYHKKHNSQWSQESWYKTAEIFKRELGLNGSCEQASNEAFLTIHRNLKHV